MRDTFLEALSETDLEDIDIILGYDYLKERRKTIEDLAEEISKYSLEWDGDAESYPTHNLYITAYGPMGLDMSDDTICFDLIK